MSSKSPFRVKHNHSANVMEEKFLCIVKNLSKKQFWLSIDKLGVIADLPGFDMQYYFVVFQ